ncbi:uncharacterized protein LOC131066864 [Cryptomeria japonica]|uniref:uncharacterized protein LOC131066864 n=1 Tax=Cryptomeria japonica TaxID=3369 RepID=UPI0027D9E7F3|nr:uncharacterized protein LOC131066864 [Cryptomeria japonica]
MRIFRETFSSVEEVILKIKEGIEEVINGKTPKAKSSKYYNWDRDMESNWSLKYWGLGVTPVPKTNKKLIRWIPPRSDWVKLNFDGAYRGNLGPTGIGAVIRNSSGILLGGLFGSLGLATNNETEIRALAVRVDLCVQKGHDKICIEGDSQIIINGVTKSGFLNWKLDKWIPYINESLGSFNLFELKHTYWEGNKVADLLANIGIDKNIGTIIFGEEDADTVVLDTIWNERPDRPCTGIG